MNIGIFTGLVASLALAACSSTSPNQSDDSLMEHLSSSQRAKIDDAREEHAHRGDALAAARQKVIHARSQWKLAKADLELADARVEQAETAVEVAANGTSDEIAEAAEKLREARANVLPQRNLIKVRACDITRCEKAEALASREADLAEANVGLEKARAFVQVDQAKTRASDVTALEARVRESQKQVALANVELEAATRECESAQRTYETKPVASR